MSDVIKEIPVPQSGQLWKALCAPVIAMAKAINGLRKLSFEPSEDSDWHFVWSEGGATLKYPPNSGNGGGLGPVVFNGSANGQPAYYLVNSDGVAYQSPPPGYPVANPD